MLMPGDDPAHLVQPDTLWSLVRKWVTPEQAEVARVTYTEPLKRMFNAPPSGATVTVDAHEDE
jgi:hypothetical protein